MVNSKRAFWQALIFTIVIFAVGLIFGFFIESWRGDSVQLTLMGSEINLLDAQLRNTVLESSQLSCEVSMKSTFAFADKIYSEAQKLEKYDAASKFNRDTLLILHRRYDLLRTMLWAESIKEREKCEGYHAIVYFFNYDPQDVDMRAKQAFFSRLQVDLKNKYPSQILLIPIAANLDITSVNLAMLGHNITKTPAILVDEKYVITDVIKIEEMEKIVFSSK